MKLSILIKRDLHRHRRRLLSVAIAVGSSTALIVVLGAVALGLYRHVVQPLLPSLPLSLLKVEPRTVSLGVLAFDASKLSGGLDARAVRRLESVDGVAAVYPIVGAAFPMRAEGGEGFLGKRMRTDVFATGVDPALVKDDIAEGEVFEAEKDGKVPVLVSRRLLDLYNTTVAPAIDKPRLSPSAVTGFEFQVTLGQSYAKGTPKPQSVRRVVARIVGVSERASMVGLTVPRTTMDAWNKQQGHDSVYTGAWVETRSPEDAGPVAAAIEAAGLKVDDTAKVIGATLAVAAGLGSLFAAILLAFAAFGIAQSFFLMVAERRHELVILRALGAKQRDLRRLVMTEALLVGTVGALGGLVFGAAIALLLQSLVLGGLPELPVKIDRLVALPPKFLAVAALLGILAAVGGAWLPSRRAAAADPGQALRS